MVDDFSYLVIIDNSDGNSVDDDEKNLELIGDCDRKFRNNPNLYFICNCGKRIRSFKGMKSHIKNHYPHLFTKYYVFCCSGCDERFFTKKRLDFHTNRCVSFNNNNADVPSHADIVNIPPVVDNSVDDNSEFFKEWSKNVEKKRNETSNISPNTDGLSQEFCDKIILNDDNIDDINMKIFDLISEFDPIVSEDDVNVQLESIYQFLKDNNNINNIQNRPDNPVNGISKFISGPLAFSDVLKSECKILNKICRYCCKFYKSLEWRCNKIKYLIERLKFSKKINLDSLYNIPFHKFYKLIKRTIFSIIKLKRITIRNTNRNRSNKLIKKLFFSDRKKCFNLISKTDSGSVTNCQISEENLLTFFKGEARGLKSKENPEIQDSPFPIFISKDDVPRRDECCELNS